MKLVYEAQCGKKDKHCDDSAHIQKLTKPLAINSKDQYDCGEYPDHKKTRYTKPLALSTIATES